MVAARATAPCLPLIKVNSGKSFALGARAAQPAQPDAIVLKNRPALRFLAVTTACATLMFGCAGRDPATTGSIGQAGSAINQASKLREAGKKDEAVALLSREAAKNGRDRSVMLHYGLALADAGREEEALATLAKAQDARRPDWRIANSQGVILDGMGRLDEAQARYRAALQMSPENPAVLSNLGLSLALSKKPGEAEQMMRRAVAHSSATPKMRQNLALVLALQGKYAEAEELARRDLPPDQAAANVRYWKESLGPARKAAADAPAKPKTVPASRKSAPAGVRTEPQRAAPVKTEPVAPAAKADAPETFDDLDLRS